MTEQYEHAAAVVTGHYHSIDLIRASEQDVRLIRGEGLTIHHPYPSEWIQNRSEKVYQGFFENIAIHINGRITQRRCPKVLTHVESLSGSFIGYFETSHAKLTLPFRKEFDPTKLHVQWRHIELDEDSELYNFASIYYGNVELGDFEQDSVDEGFFLIDASEGIIELDVAEHNATFTLKERKT